MIRVLALVALLACVSCTRLVDLTRVDGGDAQTGDGSGGPLPDGFVSDGGGTSDDGGGATDGDAHLDAGSPAD